MGQSDSQKLQRVSQIQSAVSNSRSDFFYLFIFVAIRVSDHVNEENQKRCLLVKNLPFRINPEQIIEFFFGFGNLTTDDIFIEQRGGTFTGQAVVLFEDEQFARDAKDQRDLEDLGGREVSLKDHTHPEFKEACFNIKRNQDDDGGAG